MCHICFGIISRSLYKRLPKRGFTNPFTVEVKALNLRDIAVHIVDGVFDGSQIASRGGKAKILSEGEVPAGLKSVKNARISKSAREKLSASQVTIEE